MLNSRIASIFGAFFFVPNKSILIKDYSFASYGPSKDATHFNSSNLLSRLERNTDEADLLAYHAFQKQGPVDLKYAC